MRELRLIPTVSIPNSTLQEETNVISRLLRQEFCTLANSAASQSPSVHFCRARATVQQTLLTVLPY